MINPNKKLAYTIFADIGMAPWAWVKEATDISTYVGGNCADSSGWYGYHAIPFDLEHAFTKWAIYFDRQPWYSGAQNINFDWEAFNSEGIYLAMQLKRNLGNDVIIYYAFASEEERADLSRLEILENGEVRSFIPELYKATITTTLDI